MQPIAFWIFAMFSTVALVAGSVFGGPIVAGLLVLGIIGALIAARKPILLAPLLVMAGMLLSRPNVLGERFAAPALSLFAAAAVIAIFQDKGTIHIAGREFRSLRCVYFWIGAAYVWLLARTSYHGLNNESQLWTGFLITVGCIISVAIVCGERERRIVLAKLFVGLVALCSISYVGSAALWVVAGVGSGQIGTVSIGSWVTPQPVYFPFTTTVATQPVFGIQVPRFVGFAREPGWMALYGAVAYFLMPMLGWRRKLVRLAVLMGVLGTLSTAGFGITIACIALDYILNGRSRSDFEGFLRVTFGLAVLGFALWAAFYAPVVGLDVKGEQNMMSLSERSAATEAGLWALQNDPFSGGVSTDKVGAVNLIAAIAAYGLPFAALTAMSIVASFLRHPRKRLYMPVAAAILLTLGAAQPSLDSTWAFALVVLSAAVALEPVERPIKVKAARLELPKSKHVPAGYQRS